VQPQLLLLQKNMMMAEGVSRSLDPTLNIWTLAQPLIEEWMRTNRGPEARLRDTAAEAAATLRRLPSLIGKIETAAGAISAHGLRLHPDTMENLERRDAHLTWQTRALWLAVAALAVGLIVSL